MRIPPSIDAVLCHTCRQCRARKACRTRAIVQLEAGDLPIVEASRCRACLVCVPACPFGAVKGPAEAARTGTL